MEYFQQRDKLMEERYLRLEQQMEGQRKQVERELVTDHPTRRRASMGESLRVPAPILNTPQPRSASHGGDFLSTPGSVREVRESRTEGVSRRIVSDDEAMERALKLIRGFVPLFHANSEKDKGTTVDDFVEKVESAMADVLRDHAHVKLSVVRMCLMDGALRWFNRRMEQLKDAGVDEPTWDRDVRAAFIDAHNSINTPELWLTKLQGLRLGKGSTPTPIELENQFDTIVRHLLKDPTNEEANTLFLATEYSAIIRLSNFTMYSTILRSAPHATLKQWKAAVAQQWNADSVLKVEERRSSPWQGRGGYWRGGRSSGGRGGHNQSGEVRNVREVVLHGVEAHDGEWTIEGEEEGRPELNAAFGAGGQRGGRGGRGGRVRGGNDGRPARSPEIQRLIDQQRCFRCKAVGHTQFGCPIPPTPRVGAVTNQVSQSNE